MIEYVLVDERSEMLLEAIFGQEGLVDPFKVYLDNTNDAGAVHLPLHVSLEKLVNTGLPFSWTPEVREDKVVIRF